MLSDVNLHPYIQAHHDVYAALLLERVFDRPPELFEAKLDPGDPAYALCVEPRTDFVAMTIQEILIEADMCLKRASFDMPAFVWGLEDDKDEVGVRCKLTPA